jgi:hypothetical protein
MEVKVKKRKRDGIVHHLQEGLVVVVAKRLYVGRIPA